MILELPPPERVLRETPSPAARFQEPWVPFPEGQRVLREIVRMLSFPNEGRPLNLALLADSGGGKSHLLDFLADSYPPIQAVVGSRVQVLSVEMPPQADPARMLREILRTMCVDYSGRDPPDELLRKVVIHMRSLKVLLLVLDEFHNALGGRRDHVLGVVRTLRALSNRCQRPMVVAGTYAVEEMLRYDAQLDERFVKWRLPMWSDLEQLRTTLAGFEVSMNFPVRGLLGTQPIAQEILLRTSGRPSRVAGLVREMRRAIATKADTDIDKTLITACMPRVAGQTVEAAATTS